MEAKHPYEKYRQEMDPALKSKLEEFDLLDYPDITEEDIWAYLIQKKWKKANGEARHYEIMQDIMRLKVSDYMNFATTSALVEAEHMKKDLAAGLEDFKDLFS
ncbi:post-transcriptional regulator [Pradoshia sp.]